MSMNNRYLHILINHSCFNNSIIKKNIGGHLNLKHQTGKDQETKAPVSIGICKAFFHHR